MTTTLRIFISSPGDVPDERLRASFVIDKLAQDFRRFFTFETIRWEHEPLIASGHFEDALEPPSRSDIVVLILWSRLGTPLPEKTAVREYRGIDGRAPVTGTEWEFEDALRSAKDRGVPDLLTFRKFSAAPIDTRDLEARAKSIAQLEALDVFWRRHFASGGVFLAAYHEFTTLDDFAERLEQSLRKLIERRIKSPSASESEGPIWLGPPFRGLQAYGFEHAPIFFGRDTIVAQAAEQLATNARNGKAFLLVAGASGVGKSSLVQAALIPRLTKPQTIEGAAFVRRLVFRPGGSRDPMLRLVEALIGGKGSIGLPELLAPGQTAADLAALLRNVADAPGFIFSGALARITEAERVAGRLLPFEEAKAIIVIDQLEELFTTPGITADDQSVFVRMLCCLARSACVWVVATLRADFWHRAAELPELLTLAQNSGRIDVGAPSPAELAEIIRKPAHAAGLLFETHVASGLGLDAVLAEHATASPGALPLLSYALDALYAEDIVGRNGRMLTFATYETLGGIEGAITSRAEAILASLSPPAQAALPRVLRAVATATIGADDAVVARTAPMSAFAEGSPSRVLVEALTDARLLVASSDGDIPTVRLAHEALISRWTRASRLLASDRRDLQTRAFVEQQRDRWERSTGRTRNLLLLRDPDLANAIDLGARWGEELEASTRDYIEASARRARLRFRLTAAAALVFAAIAVAASILGVFSYRSEQRLQRRETAALVAESRLLVSLAREAAGTGQTARATLLALEALPDLDDPDPIRSARPYVAAAERQLYESLDWFVPVRSIAAEAPVMGIACSGDGQKLYALSSDGVRVLDLPLGQVSRYLAANPMSDATMFVSDEGDLVAVVQQDGLTVWDLKQKSGGPTALKIAGLRVLGFTAEEILVFVSADGAVRGWDPRTNTDRFAFQLYGSLVRTVTLSRTENALYAYQPGTLDDALDEYRGDNPERIILPDILDEMTTSFGPKIMRVSLPDGKTTEVLESRMDAEIGYAELLASDGGSMLAIGDWARVYDASNARLIPLRGLDGQLSSLAFDSDGSRLLTVSREGRVGLWDPRTGYPVGFLSDRDKPRLAAFCGSRIVTSDSQKPLQLWAQWRERPIAVLPTGGTPFHSARFSANGSRIVTSREITPERTKSETSQTELPQYELIVWDVATQARKFVSSLSGYQPLFAISPDGAVVFAAVDRNRIRMWHVDEVANSPKDIVLPNQDESIYAIAVSSHYLATLGSSINVWRTDDLRHVGSTPVSCQWMTFFRIDEARTSVVVACRETVGSGPFKTHSASALAWNFVTNGIEKKDTGEREGTGHTGDMTGIELDQTGHIAVVAVRKDQSDDEDGTLVDKDDASGPSLGHLTIPLDYDGSIIPLPGARDRYVLFGDRVELFDRARREVVASFAGAGALDAALLRDNVLLSFSRDGKFKRYYLHLTTQDAVSAAKDVVPFCLQQQERKKAFLRPDPPKWCSALSSAAPR